ncbi:MAG: hypothetical protein KVP17_002168 [Porospora cf. gigantea B]|uniref:uncharacterized protein n=1 Tax=Porospora cf. gigantea B TaxID=2853592 RepID=UPI0035719F32|nr:MAG: hypothetical protein KVP17_002168 [Porospora cf. gigantea B]
MKHFYSVTEDKRLVKIPEPDQDQGPHLLANLLLLHMSDALELYSSGKFPDTIVELSEVVDDEMFTYAEADLEICLTSRLTSDLASHPSDRGLVGLFSTFFGGKDRGSALWTQDRSDLSAIADHVRKDPASASSRLRRMPPPPLPPAETPSRRPKRLESEAEERRKARRRRKEDRRQWVDAASSAEKLTLRGAGRLDRKEEVPDSGRRKDDSKYRPRLRGYSPSEDSVIRKDDAKYRPRLRRDSPSEDSISIRRHRRRKPSYANHPKTSRRQSSNLQSSNRNRRPKDPLLGGMPTHSETGYGWQPQFAEVQSAYGKCQPQFTEAVYERPCCPPHVPSGHPGSQGFPESPAFSRPLSASPYPPYPPYPVMYVTYHMAPPGYPPGLYPPPQGPYPQGPYLPPGLYPVPQASYPYNDRKRPRDRSRSSNRQSLSSAKHSDAIASMNNLQRGA